MISHKVVGAISDNGYDLVFGGFYTQIIFKTAIAKPVL